MRGVEQAGAGWGLTETPERGNEQGAGPTVGFLHGGDSLSHGIDPLAPLARQALFFHLLADSAGEHLNLLF